MKVTILGLGMIGSTVAHELLNSPNITELTLIDANQSNIDRCLSSLNSNKASGSAVELTNHNAVVATLKESDIAIACLPHFLSLPVIHAAIEARCHLIDLVGSDYPEKIKLHEKAIEYGVLIVPGMGVAPGIVNILAARGIDSLDEADEAIILSGGIPRYPLLPLWYQVVFRLESVMGLYTRPAHAAESGVIVNYPALSGLEAITFPDPVGQCEAVYSDAHSVAYTLKDKVNRIYEKTVRYKGHFEKMAVLQELGFLNEEPVTVDGIEVAPRSLTMAVLEPQLKGATNEDITVVRVAVTGIKDGQNQKLEWNMMDHYDHEKDITSMAKTTSMPAVILAEWIAKGKVNHIGVVTPEEIIIDDFFDPFLAELAAKGIHIGFSDSISDSHETTSF